MSKKSTPAAEAITEVTCAACGTRKAVKATKTGSPRLPKGWKSRPNPDTGNPVRTCQECWKRLYRLRAVTFPVAEVLDGGTWKEFCEAVKEGLGRARSLAQWAVNRLAQTDVVRTSGEQRMPAHPPIYLYGEAASLYPDWSAWAGAMTAANAVLHACELKYGSKRREVVWWGSASLSTIRSCPYPVPAQNWRARWTEYTSETTSQVSRVPAVSIPLGGRRWLLRLRGGQQRARQLAAFAHLVSGAAEAGELAIYRKRSQANRNRSGMNERTAPGGGSRVRTDIMVKLVAWLPREQRPGQRVREGALVVHSSPRAFLVATHPNFDRPWVLNRNEVRRRILIHQRRLQQISEDTKAEVRQMPAPRGPWRQLTDEERKQRRARRRARRHRLDYYQKICTLYRDYLRTFVHEAAAWLAAYADRLGVAKVVLDLSEHRYCPSFPWAALRQRIETNLDERGIDLELSGDSIEDDENTDAVEPANGEAPAEQIE